VKKKHPITAGALVRKFGARRTGKDIQKMVEEARKGWKTDVPVKRRRK